MIDGNEADDNDDDDIVEIHFGLRLRERAVSTLPFKYLGVNQALFWR